MFDAGIGAREAYEHREVTFSLEGNFKHVVRSRIDEWNARCAKVITANVAKNPRALWYHRVAPNANAAVEDRHAKTMYIQCFPKMPYASDG